MPRLLRSTPLAAVLLPLVLAVGVPAAVVAPELYDLVLSWPEDQRAFALDGPGFLLDKAELDELMDKDQVGRAAWIEGFLADPIPDTDANELRQGLARRAVLVRRSFPSFLDDRARLLFLQGPPIDRELIDCVAVFHPAEIWTYPAPGLAEGRKLLLYRPKPDLPWRVWMPSDGKRVLYIEEVQYLLQQVEEHNLRGEGSRWERQICDQIESVDEATGIDLLYGFRSDRPSDGDIAPYFAPPSDLADWARRAAAEAAPAAVGGGLEGTQVGITFPERRGLRMATHLTVTVPATTALGVVTNERERQEIRVTVEGLLEHQGRIFDRFRMRFLFPPPAEPTEIALVAPRQLRPGQSFLARLRVTDEVTGNTELLSTGFVVPREPTPIDPAASPVADELIIALGEELDRQRVAGMDSLKLLPPETDVTFGLWRAQALVTGTGIQKVIFYVDGQQVFKRSRPPFTAELRLPAEPTEQVVRAEGLSAGDEILASDEVVLNQPRGALQVRILEPRRGTALAGTVEARVEVVVPEERKVERVRFSVDEQEVAVLETPPWHTPIEIPPTYAGGQDLHYLTVVAELDDGSSAEDVRFLNPPPGIEEVGVNLVELYTTVSDKSGRLVRDLGADSFSVWEDDRPQTLTKLELVENLPLTLGITLDTSGSMFEAIAEAKRAAVGFLEAIITPRDIAFAVAFSDRPALIMPRTSDVGAIAERLENLLPNGSTALHDALVTSLYYFRGIRGRRALVVLSDGEDTSSTITFPEALEYARRSGVAIYAIGLKIRKTEIGVRRKLEAMAAETGGRTFYIKEAAELHTVYDEIERELRSQYLVAYNSDQAKADGAYRQVTVEVRDARGKKLEARTIRGYYP